MARRCFSLWLVGLAGLLLVGSLTGTPLQAQDRGAPRFGPLTSDDARAGKASERGRLWSLATLPFDRFEARYGVEADSAWATHLRRGLLRLPGCAAALVSADGLALTSADCVRKHRAAGRIDAPVTADRPSDEQSLPGLHVDRLLDAETVTARVDSAERDTTSEQAVAAVQERLQSAAGPDQRVEVVAEAGGQVHVAYTYRRYDDVRLAFLPGPTVSRFGGAEAAMAYPRQALDAALIRVYTTNGDPLSVDHFFEVPTQDVRPGDAIFAAGPARKTHRAESADQLAARRDLVLRNRRDVLDTWVQSTRAFLDTAGSAQQVLRAALRAGERAQKRVQTRLEALRHDSITTRLQRRDRRLRDTLRRDPALQRRYGGVLNRLAALQESKRRLASAHRAFGTFGARACGSRTFQRMVRALRADTTEGVRAPAPIDDASRPPAVETALLADRLRRVREHLQSDSAAVRRLLDGQSPSERAASIVDASVLAESDYAPDGTPIVPPDDPAAAVADVIGPRVRSFYAEWERLMRTERRLTARLARARRTVDAAPVRGGGDRVLRLTDGRALGYPYNGTMAPPFTTLYGLYGQSQSFEGDSAWALPARWHRSSTDLDRSVPLNLAVSTDPAVQTDGAPLLNKYLEIVGVSIGTNVQGVAGEYLFLPQRMRTVGVDLRGLRQSLQAVYDAEGLVDELFGDTVSRSGQRQ
ncbi:MAG: S46 family peptidase [Salinibacter sp.]